VVSRRLVDFRLAVHPAPAADDDLDVLGGARAADREQSLFGVWSRHTRQRPNLGVRELAARQCSPQPRQRPERPRHADMLARGAELESDAPGKPVRARPEAVAPAAAGVEVADEIEQPRGGSIELRGELGDLVAEPLELDAAWMRRDHARTIDVHRRFSLHRLYPSIFGACRSYDGERSRGRRRIFLSAQAIPV